MQLNATVIDSSTYHDIFSTSAMRAVWSDQARIQRYLDVEKALSVVEARLGVIPSEAAEEIGRDCNVFRSGFRETEVCDGAHRLLDPTNYLGNPGAMVDRVLNRPKG